MWEAPRGRASRKGRAETRADGGLWPCLRPNVGVSLVCNRGYSSPGPTVLNINPVVPGFGFSPFYSPFGFGGFGGYGYIGAPVLGIPQLLAWPLFFYLAFQVFRGVVAGASDRLGSFWDSRAAEGASDITVVRLNLAVNLKDRSNSVIGRLAAIAASDAGGAAGRQGNLYSIRKMGEITSEVALTLLRQRSNWQAANFDASTFRDNVADAETAFNKRVIFERSKFENENPMDLMTPGQIGGRPTVAVVTMIVGVKGKSGVVGDICSGRARVTENSVVELLETIAAEASKSAYSSTDDPDSGLVSAELLWTPSSPDEVLSRQEILMDYPELIDL